MNRIGLLLLVCCLPAWGQAVEIIVLGHRSAEALLPQLVPFVEPGGALAGAGNQIFVRASPRNQDEIRRLVAALDTPLRRLMIHLRQEGGDEGAQADASVSGRVDVGAGGTAISGRGEFQRGQSRSRRTLSHQVQTHDGAPAAIMVGQSALVPMRQVVVGPGGVIVAQTTVRRDLASGFVALPRLSGDRVTIEIRPRDDTAGPTPGSANRQYLVATVSGRLGEWIELGATQGDESASADGLLSRSAHSASRQRRLLLRVEELP